MKKLIFTVSLLTSLQLFAGTAQTYCGWISNPTPGNVWMEDASGTLQISEQGGPAPGGVDLEAPAPGEQVEYNAASYGDSCGCILAEVKSGDGMHFVTNILRSKAKKLSACLGDKNIWSSYKPITLVQSAGSCDLDKGLLIRFKGRSACVNEANQYYYLAN